MYYNQTEYGEDGGEVYFVAAEHIDGNPLPTVEWVHPNDSKLAFAGRYSFPTEERLLIMDIEEKDYGTYRFTAKNGIGNAIVVNQTLISAG